MSLPHQQYLPWILERLPATRFDLASSGAPSIAPEALGLGLDALTDYTAPQRFRDALSARYGVPTDEIGFALGASGAVWATCRALLEPGETIAIERPAYEPLVRVPEGLGARVVRFDRRAEDRWALDPDAVMQALGATGRVAMVTDLHNPTGGACDRAALRELARALAARDGWLIVDEVYRDAFARRDGAVTARTIAPNVIAISSLTKLFGLGWARGGWVLAPASLCGEIDEAMRHTAGWYGFLYASAGAAALSRADSLLDRTLDLVGDRLTQVDAVVRARPALHWVRPEGGLFGFVSFTEGAGRTARRLIDGPCAARGVLVGDGRFFDAPGAFRVGCTLGDEAAFREGLALLADALDEYILQSAR